MRNTLIYAHDPMCSWCWGFGSVWEQLKARLPEGIRTRRLLGGLAPDTEEAMDAAMRSRLQATWRRIETQIPGVRFNFDFWQRCRPRRSTYPACRAVIAARQQGVQHDEGMTRAIQRAYYRQARNPSEEATLIELAAEQGLDTQRFIADLHSTQTQRTLEAEINQCRSLGIDSFPALVLETDDGSRWPIGIDYNDASYMLETISALMQA